MSQAPWVTVRMIPARAAVGLTASLGGALSSIPRIRQLERRHAVKRA